MIVYSVKYALRLGIIWYEAEQHGDFVSAGSFGQWLKLGRDAFLTFSEAQAAAKKMQLKKVNSLEKQLVKLRKMSFETFKAAN